MQIFTFFPHEVLMILNIIFASIHILLSIIGLIFVLANVKVPHLLLPIFLGISIFVCILILLYSIDCYLM